jgi:hypothetical protein
MFELFGTEMPLAVRFFLAFLIVLGLIGVAAWAVRRFGSARLGGAVRGRQPRLAVIDYASVDARRRLILVRRDNVEHLVMIGGPTDVVVEANIVRAAPATRDIPAARPAPVPEILPRAIPLPEAASNGSGGSWPLQPEPPASTPPARPQREALSTLADDLASHPVPPLPPLPPVAPAPATVVPASPAALVPPRSRTAPTPRAEPRTPAAPADNEASSLADQSLAEMAQRLEAALRKPKAIEPASAPSPAPVPEPETAAPVPPPRPARPAEPKPARAETKVKESSKVYDTLEQEMASLLGRPSGKS